MEFRDNPLSAPFFVPGIFSTFSQERLKKKPQQRLSSPTSKTNIVCSRHQPCHAVTLGCSPGLEPAGSRQGVLGTAAEEGTIPSILPQLEGAGPGQELTATVALQANGELGLAPG